MGTWSYTIMGSTEAFIYDYCFFSFIQSFFTEKEKKLRCVPDSIINVLIEKNYDELVNLVIEQKSRLAFQVFGVFLMRYGAKMTEDVRKLILKHSRWEDEQDQLLDSKDRTERLLYLSDFREKVITYKEGIMVSVPYESPDNVVQKLRKQGFITTDYPFINAPKKFPINHIIKD